MELALDGLILDHRLGEGGMGVVWRARHRASGTRVAVKCIRAERAAKRSLRQAFQREVEAMAAMDHPSVVLVYDHGTVDAAAARASEGALRSGSPYVVMEHASGGCLDGSRPPPSWDAALPILLQTLEALAHAHARGVIHRDLKPGNLLICGPEDARPGLKLADFGLARLLESPEGPHHAGTPWYMAPEQFQGRWRDLGPQTDLYALGCVAWELVSGSLPFDQPGITELRQHHLHAPLPALEARFPLPDGFDDWLRWLLEKAPGQRPESAAAAAWALRALPPAPEGQALHATPMNVRRSTPTFTWATLPPMADIQTESALEPGPGRTVRPPLSARWQDQVEARPPLLLTGAGLGLFSVRRAPFTGRHAERQALWDALHRAATDGPTGLLLRGPAGVGRTRLGQWLAERSEELGVATARMIRAQPAGASVDSWLRQELRLEGLDPEGSATRIARAVREPGPLLDWVRGSLGAEAAAAAWLVAEAAHRPQVLVLDDAHLDSSLVALGRRVLAARHLGHAPVLVLFTASDAAPGIEGLQEKLDLHTLALSPLDGPDTEHLLARTIDLFPATAARVHASCGGIPALVLHVIGDWVRRGRLQPGPSGFTVAEAEADLLPTVLADVWAHRVDAALYELSAPHREALALALAPGSSPDPDWAALCLERQLDPDGLTHLLVAHGLAERAPEGWRAVSPAATAAMSRALQGEALEAHRAWLSWLDQHLEAGPTSARRLAPHLLALGLWRRAAEALFAITDQSADRGPAALASLQRAEAALDRAGAPRHDPLRHEVTLRKTAILFNVGHPTASDQLASLVALCGTGETTADFRGRAQRVRAQVLARSGRVDEAEAVCMELLQEFPGTISAHLTLGMTGLMRRRIDQTVTHMQAALDLDPTVPFERASALTGMAEALRHRGDLHGARALHEQALALALASGWRDAATSALNLAQVDIELGDLRAAAARLAEVRQDCTRHLDWFPLAACLAMQAQVCTALGRWAIVDECVQLLPAVHRLSLPPDPDLAEALVAASEGCLAADRTAAAHTLATLAQGHAERLQIPELTARVDAQLAACES